MQDAEFNSIAQGRIDTPGKGEITGWIVAVSEDVFPLVLINGRQAKIISWSEDRPDVSDALGLSGGFGFRFECVNIEKGDTLELFAVKSGKILLLDSILYEGSYRKTSTVQQLRQAVEVSKVSNAVAVTCWDGGHNPIGRAHVLYKILLTQRPAIIVAYLFEEFSKDLWEPLSGQDLNILLIPWKRRVSYLKLLDILNIKFDTIWMCKSRLPTLDLSAQIAHESTKVILDHDDNEAFFASKTKMDTHYGANSVSLSRFLSAKIASHTAASSTLATKFDARIVRHTRSFLPRDYQSIDVQNEIRIGFVGTVREHKGVRSAARAIRLAAWTLGLKLKFCVFGHFETNSLLESIKAEGAEVSGVVPMSDLTEKLKGFDIVLTGWPEESTLSEPINEYQISSKIGDALAASRPVLVPRSPSTLDLEDTPGLFLFSAENFAERLMDVLRSEPVKKISHDFTHDAGYREFLIAEKKAQKIPAEFDLLKMSGSPINKITSDRSIVLIWKQHDAAIYGRRIDQIARDYKRYHPEVKVVVLEICHESSARAYQDQATEFASDARLIEASSIAKSTKGGAVDGDVFYHSIVFSSSDKLEDTFINYLYENNLKPDNTTLILFPIIPFFDRISEVLSLYPVVVDVVDNQFSWAKKETSVGYAGQYLELFRISKGVIFNSDRNRSFFENSGILENGLTDGVSVNTVPNWASSFQGGESSWKPLPKKERNRNFLYSGNLNDRIDWGLLQRIGRELPGIKVHIVGNGRRVKEQLATLRDSENIVFWGPLPEGKVWQLSQLCSAGLVPHKVDHVSEFMNPIKVKMYRKMGLRVISTDMPGIDEATDLKLCQSEDEFINAMMECSSTGSISGVEVLDGDHDSDNEELPRKYIQIINNI